MARTKAIIDPRTWRGPWLVTMPGAPKIVISGDRDEDSVFEEAEMAYRYEGYSGRELHAIAVTPITQSRYARMQSKARPARITDLYEAIQANMPAA